MMISFSRFIAVSALLAGLGGVAHAQSRHPQVAPDRFYAMSEGRDLVGRAATSSRAVAPSESQTIMGLRVPR